MTRGVKKPQKGVNKVKTVGIIGGLGPETSAKFCLEIVASCLQENKTQRPPILSWNIPLPLKIEEDLLTKNKGEKKYLPFLVEATKLLEKAGADFLVMPCNTMHIFIKSIKDTANIPVLSIIDETIIAVRKRNISKVGLLATSTTIRKKLFLRKLKRNRVQVTVPNRKQQQRLDQIIHNLVMGKRNREDKIAIEEIITDMKNKGTWNIILACTDLQLIVKKRSDIEIFDTMKILADATVNRINTGLISV